VAIIYFTRLVRSKSGQTKKEYLADISKENEHKNGYRFGGPLTKVRNVAMIVSLWKMRQLSEEIGFEVIVNLYSHDGKGEKTTIHGQHGIVLRKPRPKKTSKSSPQKKLVSRKKSTNEIGGDS
jgi:hypothetical protein